MDVEMTVEEILDIAVDLIEITSFETELLQEYTPTEIQDVMERKVAIANFYNDMLKKLERRRANWHNLDEKLTDEIRETNAWVQYVMEENGRLLQAAGNASERLLVAIKKAAEDHYGGTTKTYSRSGTYGQRANSDTSVRVSLGLDEEY